MFLTFDVEVVKNFLFFGLCNVGIRVLIIEFLFQESDIFILLLKKFNEVFVFINEMSVLGQQKLDFILQVIDSFIISHLQH